MLDPQPALITEPEGLLFPVSLQGTGGAVPTRLHGRNNYTIARTGVGAIKLSFQDDPGPVCMGIVGYCFNDAAPANVWGWSLAGGVYTPRAGAVPASYTFAIGNAANAAADLAVTSSLSLKLQFKQAPEAL